ncbi:hypothetical protein NDU88_003163 [Pleurodeles waltl]|uniref:Uncharacterized protein n=1 Tax=Pleurodeles waltl TaxID=8319 RepID=A0AAV7SCN8_PLEWA|nr:hypothetical protein NDU88_003163 [Pleurodeles waltl]
MPPSALTLASSGCRWCRCGCSLRFMAEAGGWQPLLPGGSSNIAGDGSAGETGGAGLVRGGGSDSAGVTARMGLSGGSAAGEAPDTGSGGSGAPGAATCTDMAAAGGRSAVGSSGEGCRRADPGAMRAFWLQPLHCALRSQTGKPAPHTNKH